MGSTLKTFVVNELMKISPWSKTSVMYHSRTTSNQAVDIVLEAEDGRLVDIEIKSTETPTSQDFKGLRDLKKNAGKQFVCGVLLYLGSQVLAEHKTMIKFFSACIEIRC